MTLVYPITVIDIESSGLGEYTYPIELGVARRNARGGTLFTWQSLIRPTPLWTRDYDWIKEAQDLHGIAPADLSDAPKVETVIDQFEAFLGNAHSIISDNPFHDQRWLDTLYRQDGKARTAPRLHWPKGYNRELLIRERTRQRHRAKDDAVQALTQLEETRST